ncbi:MAG: ABC transporter permease [Deltaproteobacteria bacterium]|nr:ABC transporter permease [Deltaproteobacteria bacterium]
MFNFYGLYILFAREVWRFLKVSIQTILTPVITVLLYLLIFSSVISRSREMLPGVDYLTFLVPGLMVMAMLQNAFANSSSSLFQARMNGNVIFILLAPISDFEFYLAFVGAAVVRGLLVGLGVWLAAGYFVWVPLRHPLSALLLIFFCCGSLGALGLVSAIIADKWDHISAFQNFVIVPFSFLSGVFFSIADLPSFWRQASHFNPFFFLVDGFRYTCLGVSEVSLSQSLGVAAGFFILSSVWALGLLNRGYNLRS